MTEDRQDTLRVEAPEKSVIVNEDNTLLLDTLDVPKTPVSGRIHPAIKDDSLIVEGEVETEDLESQANDGFSIGEILLTQRAVYDLQDHDFRPGAKNNTLDTPNYAIGLLEKAIRFAPGPEADLSPEMRSKTDEIITTLKNLVDGAKYRQEYHLAPVNVQAEDIMEALVDTEQREDAIKMMETLVQQPDVPSDIADQLRETYAAVTDVMEEGGLITDISKLYNLAVKGYQGVGLGLRSEMLDRLERQTFYLRSADALESVARAQDKLLELLSERGNTRNLPTSRKLLRVREIAQNARESVTGTILSDMGVPIEKRKADEERSRLKPASQRIEDALKEITERQPGIDLMSADTQAIELQLEGTRRELRARNGERIRTGIEIDDAKAELGNIISQRIFGKPSRKVRNLTMTNEEILKNSEGLGRREEEIKGLLRDIKNARNAKRAIDILKEQE